MKSLRSNCIHAQFHWSNGSTRLLPVMRDSGSIPRGVFMWKRDSPVSVVLLHWWPQRDWSLWPRLRRVLSLGHRVDNVIIPLDLTQIFCSGFTLAAGPPSGFTTDIVGCWGETLCRAYNLTAFTDSSTGPVVHLFVSHHEGPGFNPQGGT
jgi:hypothetical protein